MIPLLPAVNVEALFECYEGEESTFLNIVWFQDSFSATISSYIENVIQDIDWHCNAREFSL